jgi:hypothetical protein
MSGMDQEDPDTVCFNHSGVKYDREADLAAVVPCDAVTDFMSVISYDETYVYDGYFSFVKDLPNEILVGIFSQICLKDLCMVGKGK